MTFSDVTAAIDRYCHPVGTETIPLIAAYGRISARSISSKRAMPPFDVSALDGYGLKGAGAAFEVKAEMTPFGPAPTGLKPGQAVFVPTGGRFLKGTRFVMREHATEKGRVIRIETDADERRVVQKGEWLAKGALVQVKGAPFTPESMASAALAGAVDIVVYARPKVAVITTGSELKEGRMVDSNAFLVSGLIQRDGGVLLGARSADDRVEAIAEAIGALNDADLIVLTGGTARGKKDLTREAIRRAGGRILLDSPPVTPGKTMTFGRRGRSAFFILPGNPKAIRTLYEVFVRRSLLRLAGQAPERPEHELPLPEDVRKPAGMTSLVPVLIQKNASAVGQTWPKEPSAYLVLDQEGDLVKEGTMVRVIEV